MSTDVDNELQHEEEDEERQLRGGQEILRKLREALFIEEMSNTLPELLQAWNSTCNSANLHNHEITEAVGKIGQCKYLQIYRKSVSSFNFELFLKRIKQIVPTESVYGACCGLGLCMFLLKSEITYKIMCVAALVSVTTCFIAIKIRRAWSDRKNTLLYLSKYVSNCLKESFDQLKIFGEASQKLNKILSVRVGISLYSQDFPNFCSVISGVNLQFGRYSKGGQTFDRLDDLLKSVNSSYHNNIIQLCRNKVLKDQIGILNAVVNNTEFFKINAFYKACKIIQLFPEIYPGENDDVALRCVFAAFQFLRDMQNQNENLEQMRNILKDLQEIYVTMLDLKPEEAA